MSLREQGKEKIRGGGGEGKRPEGLTRPGSPKKKNRPNREKVKVGLRRGGKKVLLSASKAKARGHWMGGKPLSRVKKK